MKRTVTFLLIKVGELNGQAVTTIVSTKFLRKKESESDVYLSLPRDYTSRFEIREETSKGNYSYKTIKTGNAWDLLKAVRLHNQCKDFSELLKDDELPF